ncbi:STAS domain-containing protein [Blastococcus saxobsidens]|uniref:Anti-sigma factor antagonist n=1 Tax=Blastococcus saxobsidens TaxID=138336 RepID=A0A4Q7Y8J7_9ACTN|nr:STAS domain-containing protein [Blastococcus saxobsidens]RZU33402.1 anti-sigma B factor antagonist [Blastococcus saxobsidens]
MPPAQKGLSALWLRPCHVELVGEIDISNSAQLGSDLCDAINGCDARDIEVDMSGVAFIDSTGINVLVAAHRYAKDNGSHLIVHEPSERVTNTLALCGLLPLFNLTSRRHH